MDSQHYASACGSTGAIFYHVDWAEEQIIEQFQRRAHHFLPSPPPLENRIDWMALIQHFGGTTRLLDFTKSFYVAAFFAVERATTECAIWCVNHYDLLLGLERLLKIDTIKSTLPHWQVLHRVAAVAEDKLRKNKHSFERFVFEVQPFRLNERLAVQQGCILVSALGRCSVHRLFGGNV